MDNKLGVTTLSELQIWIEGQFALIAQTAKTAHDDLTKIREKVHELSNDVHVILSMNLPEKLMRLEDADKEHSTDIEKLKTASAERNGSLKTLRTLYLTLGAIVGYVVTIFVNLYGYGGTHK